MKKEILVIEIAVGYMLKVIKSGCAITKFKDEFAAIRHGDYFNFINQINGPLPYLLTYQSGKVYVDDKNNSNDIDFIGLVKASNSLKIFYENCINHYGELIDNDVNDFIYCKVAAFEISLRMHANNNKLICGREKLVSVIDKIVNHFILTELEKERLHAGRRFLNMIKHNKDQFSSWTIGIEYFLMANEVLVKNKLTIL